MGRRGVSAGVSVALVLAALVLVSPGFAAAAEPFLVSVLTGRGVAVPPGTAATPVVSGWSVTPLPGARVTRGYGPGHAGVDLAVATPGDDPDLVLALADGEVVDAHATCPRQSGTTRPGPARRCGDGFGNHVIVRHVLGDGSVVYSSYAHLDVVLATSGCVSRGEPLGEVGHTGHSTGEHLHLELNADPRLSGHVRRAATIDPAALLGSLQGVLPCVPPAPMPVVQPRCDGTDLCWR